MILNKESLTSIGIVVTSVVGILNLGFSIKNNKKTQFINIVTSSRTKWMNDLREAISLYISLTPGSAPTIEEIKTNKISETIYNNFRMTEIKKVNGKIKLLLNKDGEKDEKIIKIINEIYEDILQIKIYMEILLIDSNKSDKEMIQKLSQRTCKYLVEEDPITKLKEVLLKDNCEVEIEDYKKRLIDMPRGLRISSFSHNFGKYTNKMIYEDIPVKVEKLINISQQYLKEEWERVKKESKCGDLADDKNSKNLKYIYIY